MDITRCVYSNQSLKLTFKQKLNPNWKIQFSMNFFSKFTFNFNS